MESIFMQAGSWYIRYKDADGRRVAIKTKAQGKTEAKRLAIEIEQKVERQRLGLEMRNNDSAGTVYELLQWWLETYSEGKSSRARNASVVKKHFADDQLGSTSIA